MPLEELWPGGPRFRQEEPFRLSTDSVLLADFAQPRSARRGVDLGCGAGILMLLLAQKSEKLRMTGVELRPEAVETARGNLAENGLLSRTELVCADLRRHRELFRPGSFDLVAANPPYFPKGAGAAPPQADRAAARSETTCTLEDLAEAAAWLLRTGGSFFLVHRPERLSELCAALSARGLEPKRLRLVCHRADSAPSLLLMEARRGGGPGLRIEPALILSASDGSESAEYRRIYHR